MREVEERVSEQEGGGGVASRVGQEERGRARERERERDSSCSRRFVGPC